MRTFGPIDTRSKEQLVRCALAAHETGAYEDVRDVNDYGTVLDIIGVRPALMADHHPGYSMPIGGVLGLQHHVGPGMVGYDIGCGNLYAETDIEANDLLDYATIGGQGTEFIPTELSKVMDEIFKRVAFGIGRSNNERIEDHPVFERIANSPVRWQQTLFQSAKSQLGTVGSGNHYVDLFRNRATGRLGVGVHFGSRGLGHRTASGFLAIAAGHAWNAKVSEGEMDAAPLLLDVREKNGKDYIEAMNIALEYAYAGRQWVVDYIVKEILGAKIAWQIHNNHNEARLENHNGIDLWVHRKGATPAHPGVRGFVGATMGEDAVIVEGVESEASASALYSTVHGAGRVMSRTQAAGKVKISKAWLCGNRECDYTAPAREHRKFRGGTAPECPKCAAGKLHLEIKRDRVRAGLIDFEVVMEDLRKKGIELRGGGADEAPGAYKRLDEVLAHHAGTINTVHRLQVLGVAMAGNDVFDPFKD